MIDKAFAARLHDDDPAVREQAFLELGTTALNDEAVRPALFTRVPTGCTDPDEGVRDAVAHVLGNLSGDQRCLPFLLQLLGGTDPQVRRTAALGLPHILGDPAPDHPAVLRLIASLADPDQIVRDAAAFVLGTQLDADSPALRAGLRSLLNESDADDVIHPATEAAYGLARRADPDIHTTIAIRLAQPRPGSLWLKAAAELADPRLLPPLLRLREPDNQPGDPWVHDLEEAILRCTPPTT